VTSCTAAIQITQTSFAGLQDCKSVRRNLWVQGGRHVLIFGLVSSVKQARPKHWKMSGFLHAGCLRTNWIIGHYFVHTCRAVGVIASVLGLSGVSTPRFCDGGPIVGSMKYYILWRTGMWDANSF